MDATCTIQDSIHVFSLVHKYVSRILGTYQNGWCFFHVWRNLFFLCPFLRKEVSTVANRIMGITVKIGKDTTKLQTGFLYNSKCRKNKKLYFINVS